MALKSHPIRPPRLPLRYLLPRVQSDRDFSGGPNLRDAQPELAPNEAVDSWNVTYDERGGWTVRLGYIKVNGAVYGGGLVKNAHYSTVLGDFVAQAGPSLYKGTSTVAQKTFTTSARAVFADFAGKLYAGHPVDGLFYTTDGLTWTAVANANRPLTCVAMAVWQNKLWVVLANSPTVQFSDIGDGTSWTAGKINSFRDGKDADAPVVALLAAPGIDIQGRPGLLVFKRNSHMRINDSTTGAATMLDGAVGTASALSVVAIPGGYVTLSEKGLFRGDGVGPVQSISDKFLPLWSSTQIAYDQLDLCCAGFQHGRVFVSFVRQGGTANNVAFEYNPTQNWLAPRSDAVSCYTTFGLNSEKLYGGSPTVSGQVYEMEKGGTDDGAAIAYRHQTRWFELDLGVRVMLHKLRLAGRGTTTLTVIKDFETDGIQIPLSFVDPTAAMYGSAHYDVDRYSQPTTQNDQTVQVAGLSCRWFSLRVSGSVTATTTGPQLLGAGIAPEIGAVALYGLDVTYGRLWFNT